MLPKTVIFDLDGTIADYEHRRHFVEKEKKEWDSFHGACEKDAPQEWCVNLMHMLQREGILVAIVTGRPDNFKAQTKEWLSRHGIGYDMLHMVKHGDHRNDNIIKKEIYDEEFKDKFNVLFVIDDRKRVVDMWRSIGLTCLQCAEGDF